MTAEKQCLDKALRLLGRRDHSCRELSRKLKQRGFSSELITSAIEACKKMNYLDDRRFCEGYTRHLRHKGYGVMRIVHKLKEKGVAETHIRESIEQQCQNMCQVEDCRRVIEKKIPAQQTRDRLFRFLYQRGFSNEVIKEALRETADLWNSERFGLS